MAGEFQAAVVTLVARILDAELIGTPPWLVRPAALECGRKWETVCSIYRELTGLELPEAMPPRETRRVDAVLDGGDGRPRILEVDETQHFNRYRALTLRRYPPDVPVAFPIEKWIEQSDKKARLEGGGFGKPKPPLFPAEYGRHAQRAFRDMLAVLGTETETTDTLDHLIVRLGADPVSTTIKLLPHRAAKTFLAEHAPGAERSGNTTPLELPRPSMMFAKSEFFRQPLPPDAIAALVDSFAEGRGTGQARELDFTPWSGAYNRTRTDATAFAHRNERFLLRHAVVLDADAAAHERDAARDWLARSWSIVHPHGSGGVYPSFPDPDLTNWARAYHDANYERLSHVKAHYDRDNLFRFHQSLPPI